MNGKKIIGSAKLAGTLFVMLIAFAVLLVASPAHAKNNYYPYGWCTWGAAELFNQTAPEPGVNWNGNACAWLWNAAAAGWDARRLPTSVQKGAIICWTGGVGGLGHVAYVASVDWINRQILVQEMNWTGFGQWSSRWLSMSNLNRPTKTSMLYFAGYINPVWSPSCKIPRP